MSTRSGKYGQVDFGSSTYGEAHSWSMEDQVDAEQFGTFGGGGFKTGETGNRFATGTIEGKQNFDEPIDTLVAPCDEITLYLYESTDTGGGERKHTITAQVTSLSTEVDGDSGAAVSWTINWQSSGSY